MILVAESDPSVRNLISKALLRQGYHVLQAANGVDALNVVRLHSEKPIDLLVADIAMPKMGGIELAARLQIMQPDLRILFISADFIIPQVLRIYRAKFLRNFDGTALVTKVNKLLAKGGRDVTCWDSG
jgi:CheY-like chemotaxis protein